MNMLKSGLAAAGIVLLAAGTAAARPAGVETDLHVRSGPGTNYRVIGVLPGGATVDVMGCAANWCRVAFQGQVGYASRSYLALGGPGPVYAAPAPYGPAPYAYDYDEAPIFGLSVGPSWRHHHRRHHRSHHRWHHNPGPTDRSVGRQLNSP